MASEIWMKDLAGTGVTLHGRPLGFELKAKASGDGREVRDDRLTSARSRASAWTAERRRLLEACASALPGDTPFEKVRPFSLVWAPGRDFSTQ
jgi:hypothetical protein